MEQNTNPYKIAFFDIDGTLISLGVGRMTERMKETLLRLKEKGVILCIATGRPKINVPRFEEIGFDVFLTFNGSYCSTGDGQTLYKQPIAHEDVVRIVQNGAGIKRPVSVATVDRIAANGTDQDLDEYFALAKQKVEIAKDFEALIEEDVYQMMMGIRSSEYEAVLAGVGSAKITAWWDRAVDIISAKSGKGEAVRKILEYYHLDPKDAIAFGDGENDIEMLQAVGHGVAMGNAGDAVKAAAKAVCRSAAEDGIYHYCLEHGMI